LENDQLLLTLEDNDEDKRDSFLEDARKELEELKPNPEVVKALLDAVSDDD